MGPATETVRKPAIWDHPVPSRDERIRFVADQLVTLERLLHYTSGNALSPAPPDLAAQLAYDLDDDLAAARDLASGLVRTSSLSHSVEGELEIELARLRTSDLPIDRAYSLAMYLARTISLDGPNEPVLAVDPERARSLARHLDLNGSDSDSLDLARNLAGARADSALTGAGHAIADLWAPVALLVYGYVALAATPTFIIDDPAALNETISKTAADELRVAVEEDDAIADLAARVAELAAAGAISEGREADHSTLERAGRLRVDPAVPPAGGIMPGRGRARIGDFDAGARTEVGRPEGLQLIMGGHHRDLSEDDVRDPCDGVARDFTSTTGCETPVVEIGHDRVGEYVVKWNGSYTTPVGIVQGNPVQSRLNLVRYLLDFAQEASWSAWPTCPIHDVVLHPMSVSDTVVWHCSKGTHIVAIVGSLAAATDGM